MSLGLQQAGLEIPRLWALDHIRNVPAYGVDPDSSPSRPRPWGHGGDSPAADLQTNIDGSIAHMPQADVLYPAFYGVNQRFSEESFRTS